MTERIERVERCRVCGGTDWLDVISLGEVPLANAFLDPDQEDAVEPLYPVDVIWCRTCSLMSLRHVVDPEALFRDYVYVTSGSEQITEHMARIVEWCVDRAAPGTELVVEVGSNVGDQLRLFQATGRRVVGVDPARNLAARAEEAGVPTRAEFFGPEVGADIAAREGRAGLVLARQCFAHIDDVHAVLDGVDEVLAADGVLAIEVPYLLDLLLENQFDTIYHEHLSYFSVHALAHLFTQHGLRLVDVARAAVHGGSIVVFAARTSSENEVRETVADILATEVAHGLTSDAAYTAFAERARDTLSSVRDLVRELRADGRRVAGYGAPSKGCALLQFSGLDHKDIEFCSDTTPGKQGTLIAGVHVPVVAPSEAAAREPDYYVLLAWNYAEEIIGNEQGFLERGGRFIVPLPEPRIVSSSSRIAPPVAD